MKRVTEWDEELGSFILTEEYKGDKLSERDLINYIGKLENVLFDKLLIMCICYPHRSGRYAIYNKLMKEWIEDGIN